MNWQEHLQTKDSIFRPWTHDRVSVTGNTMAGTPVNFSIVGPCYSEFKSGPNIQHLANVAGSIFGQGFYGLESCRPLGFRA